MTNFIDRAEVISTITITDKSGLAFEATACVVQPDLGWPGHMTRFERALMRGLFYAISMIPKSEGRLVPENAAYSQRQRVTGSVFERTSRSLRTLARGYNRGFSKIFDFQNHSLPATTATYMAQTSPDYPTNQHPDRVTYF